MGCNNTGPYTITLEDKPLPEEADAVNAALWEYNERATADAPLPVDWRQLTVLLRDADGTVVGGLRGQTNWGWLFVGKMAIREEARRQGLGTQILALAEQEARARGCHHAYVDTLSFQALPFYLKQGYTVFGTLDQYPGENKQYFLQKQL